MRIVLIPNARRAEIKDIVLTVLKLSKIDRLPVTLQKILDLHGWAVTDFKTAESFGIPTPYDSGFTLCAGSRKMFYTMMPIRDLGGAGQSPMRSDTSRWITLMKTCKSTTMWPKPKQIISPASF